MQPRYQCVNDTKYRCVRIVVEGSHEFPFDMLRYDSCVPATGEDVHAMVSDSYGPLGVRVQRRVTLHRYVPVGGQILPETARWASFGWRVVSVGGVNL